MRTETTTALAPMSLISYCEICEGIGQPMSTGSFTEVCIACVADAIEQGIIENESASCPHDNIDEYFETCDDCNADLSKWLPQDNEPTPVLWAMEAGVE